MIGVGTEALRRPSMYDIDSIGSDIGSLVGTISNTVNEYQTGKQNEANKAKIDAYLMAYNNPNDQTIFGGMQGSQRTRKLARLLMPLDSALAGRYETKANEEEVFDKKMTAEKEIAGIKFDEKKAESESMKEMQKQALAKVNEATALWSANREDVNLQNALRSAINEAKALKINVENPIDDYMRQKGIDANLGLRTESMESQKQQNEWQRVQDEKRSKREDQRLAMESQRLANETKASADKMAQGSKLSTETISKVSNLRTVLQGIAEIKQALNDIDSPLDIAGMRDLMYSADLASENLGRVQSGGAITNDELGTFKRLVSPRGIDIFDSGATYLRNVQKLEKSINDKINAFASEGRTITTEAKQQVAPAVAPSGRVW